MRRGLIGLILLALVAVVAVVLTQTNLGQVLQRGSAPAPVKVAIFYGGEKSALLADPAVQSILTGRYGVTLDSPGQARKSVKPRKMPSTLSSRNST